jgi:hypothetical protein
MHGCCSCWVSFIKDNLEAIHFLTTSRQAQFNGMDKGVVHFNAAGGAKTYE